MAYVELGDVFDRGLFVVVGNGDNLVFCKTQNGNEDGGGGNDDEINAVS